MRTKKEVRLTSNTEAINTLESITLSCNMAKSQALQEMSSLWLKKRTEELMAQGYIEISEEERRFAETSLTAQAEILL